MLVCAVNRKVLVFCREASVRATAAVQISCFCVLHNWSAFVCNLVPI